MLIILEGPDGAGKSTLARRLGDELLRRHPSDKLWILHKGPPGDTHPLDEYERPLYPYRPGRGHHVICDRWHVGEAVYPRVLGRSSRADEAVTRHLDAFLTARGALLVYVCPSLDVNLRRLRDRGDDLITTGQVAELRKLYADYLRRTIMPSRSVTATDVSSETVNALLDRAALLDAQTRSLNRFVTYVGPRFPSALLLGDVRHGLRDIPRDTLLTLAGQTIRNGPAFGPYPATSGHYLLTHVPGGLWDQGLGLANACDVDDVRELVATLTPVGDPYHARPPLICTLGRRAWACARAALATTQLGAAAHPQYVRRFYHRDGFAYGAVLMEATTLSRDKRDWRPR